MKKKWYEPKNPKQGGARFLFLMIFLTLYLSGNLLYGLYTKEIFDGFSFISSRGWVSYIDHPAKFYFVVLVHIGIIIPLICGAYWAWNYCNKMDKTS